MTSRNVVYNVLNQLNLRELKQLGRENGFKKSDKMTKKAIIHYLLNKQTLICGGGLTSTNEVSTNEVSTNEVSTNEVSTDEDLLKFWGYRNYYSSWIGKSDPKLPFKVNNAIKYDIFNLTEHREIYGQDETAWMGPDDDLIIIPKGTRLFHGTWIANPSHPITDYQFPTKEYTHFGLYPVISAFILLETLKKYNWKHGTDIPVIIVAEVIQDIEVTYTSAGGCDVFIRDLVPEYKTTMSGFGITCAPRYSETEDCSFNESVPHCNSAHYEMCLYKDDMKWVKPTHYAIVDFNKLMKNCAKREFDVLEAIFPPEEL